MGEAQARKGQRAQMESVRLVSVRWLSGGCLMESKSQTTVAVGCWIAVKWSVGSEEQCVRCHSESNYWQSMFHIFNDKYGGFMECLFACMFAKWL